MKTIKRITNCFLTATTIAMLFAVTAQAQTSGTPGKVAKFKSNTSLGDSVITEDKEGRVGVGTASPASKLTVQGAVEALNGFKFPDGTLQTTAGLSSVIHDMTLVGNGTSLSPLGIASGPVSKPFQRRIIVTLTPLTRTNSASFTVADNKRLVIEFASANGDVPLGQKILGIQIDTSVDGQTASHYLVPFAAGSIGVIDLFAASQHAVIHADPGSTVTITITRNDSIGNGRFEVGVSGHLVDMP